MVPFEIATEYQFKCPECGGTMDYFDYSKKLKDTNQRIEILKKEAGLLKKLA